MTGTSPDWLLLLRTSTARFTEIVAAGDLEAPVTFCPGWALRDLADHLGGVHEWAAHAVTERNPDLRSAPSPSGQEQLSAWYSRQAAHLLQVLEATPAEAAAWTLDAGDPTAGFWRRRQVHETVLHLWDAEEALGESRPIEPWLAWDGVREVVDVLYPRQVRLGRIEPLGSAVRLVATDVGGEVTLGAGERFTVAGSAEELFRLLWHRVARDAVSTDPGSALLLSTAVTP